MRANTPFKVTDFGTNRKLIYDFLLVINLFQWIMCREVDYYREPLGEFTPPCLLSPCCCCCAIPQLFYG